MTGDGPPRLHFDPKSGAVPDEVGPGALPQGAGGGVVTLFLAADADREWAGRTAIELARTWGDAGQRVFLGDLCFGSPVLHDLLDEPAFPSLADVILRQVRIEEVVRSVVAGSFLFAPACSADAEAPQIMGDVGWEGLIAGFAEVGATVVFFADEHAPGLGDILEASTTVYVLAASGAVEPPPEVAARVKAVLQPPARGPSGPEPFDVDPESDEGVFGSWDEDPPEPTPPRAEAPPREWETYLEDDSGEPVTDRAAHSVEDGTSLAEAWVRRMLPGLVTVIVGLLMISIAWPDAEDSAPVGLVDDGLSSEEAGVERTPPPIQPAAFEAVTRVAARAASKDDPALGYSLALASYRDASAALSRAEALGLLRPGVAFIVVPVRVGGTDYYRLLAVAASVAEASALRGQIGSVTAVDDSSAWIVWRTPLAFELSAMSDLEAARSLVARARSQGIYAYIVIQNGADQPIYAVLAGAYQGADEATALGVLLADAGFPGARLKPRIGRMVR